MRPWATALLLVLIPLTALPSPIPPAEAQRGHGSHGGHGTGSGSRPPRPRDEGSAEQDRAGAYGFATAEVLEAIERGEGRQALAAYEQAANEAEARGALATAVRANAAAAIAARRLGMLQQALRAGTRAMELGRRAPPSLAVDRALLSASINVGYAYRSVGNLAQARRVLDEGLTSAQTQTGAGRQRGLHAAMAAVLDALAQIDVAQGDRAGALAHAQAAAQALDSIDLQRANERTRFNVRRHAAGAYMQLARLALGAQRPDEAAAALGKASQYARLVALTETDAQILALSAQVALQRNDAAGALRLVDRGRAQVERVGVGRLLVEFDRVAARANERLGKIDEALVAAQSAIAGVEDVRSELQDTTLRAGFLDQRQGLYAHAVHLALRAQKPDVAFALAERSRSRAFLDMLGNQAVLSRGRTRALAPEEARLRAQMSEAATLSQEAADDEDAVPSKTASARTIAVERDYRAFLERVRREDVEQASLMSVEPVTLAEIQALLPEGTTLLEYFVGEHDVVLWVVDRQGVLARRTAVGRAPLVAEVREFRAAIASQAPLPEIETRARALYQRLVAPARAAIHGDRLLIVPHDVLHYLPFGALRGPDDRWLVEAYALGTAPSASVLKFLAGKGAHASDRILAIGNPDLGPALALRYAEREVRAIGERFPTRTTVLTRAEATESRAKQLGGQAGLLHFAVHSELNENDPMASALALAPGQGEDGRLEVRELFTLELAARLVVLSACETGLGTLSRGDELVGLQRAFLYAGTPAVVTTLWKVDDQASFLLMRSFYESLEATGPAEALRAAQRALMATVPHPFAWAAFGLTGAPR